MYKLIEIKKSSKAGKKWTAYFEDTKTGRTKTTHFGASGMEDYTQHKDPERKERYRQRHKKDLRTDDPTRAGYLSYYILWNKTSMAESIRDYRKRFGL